MNIDDATIQFVGWANNRVETRFRIGRIQDARVVRGKINARIELFKGFGSTHLGSQWRPRQSSSFICLTIPEKSGLSQHLKLSEMVVRLQNFFSSIGALSRWVKPERLLSIYQELILPDLDAFMNVQASWSEFEFLNEQLIDPGVSLEIKRTSMCWNNGVEAKTYVIKKFPAEWLPGQAALLNGNMFERFRFCPFPVLQSVSFEPTGISREFSALRAARKEQESKSFMRHFIPNIQEEKKDWEEVTHEISKGASVCRLVMHLVLFAPAGRMADADLALKNVTETYGFRLASEDGLHLPTFCCAMPLGGNNLSMEVMGKLGRTRKMFMSNAVSLVPIFGEWRGNDAQLPPVLLLNGRKGAVFGWTPFQSETNYNVVIVGQSGSGKSVVMQEMMFGLIEAGGSAVVIDDGYSFRNSCEILGGTHIDFSDPQLQLNPFAAIDAEAIQSDVDFAENVYSMLTAFIIALAHPGGSISDLERAIVTDIVQQVWKVKGNEGKIDHVVLLLSKQEDEIARQLMKLLLPLLPVMPMEGYLLVGVILIFQTTSLFSR